MLDYGSLYTSLKNRIGFRQTFDTEAYPSLDPELLDSEGLYVNSVNDRYLAPEIISQFFANYPGMKLSEWSSTNNYGQNGGKKVYKDKGGIRFVYVSKVNDSEDNLDKDPETETAFWQSAISFKLKEIVEDSTKELVSEVIAERNVEREIKTLMDHKPAFIQRWDQKTREKKGRFIGYAMNPLRNIKYEIHEVSFTLTQSQLLTFYLYHSSQPDALQTFDLNVPDTRFNWYDLNLTINYWNQNMPGGLFYLGYYEDDLQGQLEAVDSCKCRWGCPDKQLALERENYILLKPISFEPQFLNGTDRPNIGEQFENSSGLDFYPFNFKMSTICDITPTLLKTIGTWDLALQHKIAVKILSEMASNPDRINGIVSNARDKILFLLHGNEALRKAGGKSLINMYNLHKNQVKINYTGIDSICLRSQVDEGTI